jgi:tungstate transport system ATP-binding protein
MQKIDSADITLSNLVHQYNGKTVLDIDYLSFTRGSIYAVLGHNGSGKTTLLTILGLLLKPSAGKVFFEGKDIYLHSASITAMRSKMSTVIQNPLLFDTTVENNIAYGLKIRGIPKADRKRTVHDCLQLVGLEGFEKRKAKELSGGEAQRIAIARALAIKPQVLFLDEFTANVDEKTIALLEDVITRVNRTDRSTIFLVTHDTHQAYRLADEVINLFQGRVVRPSLENLFRGTIEKINNLSVFDTGRMRMEVVSEKRGSAYAVIDPRDIIVSDSPLRSSARNSFYGIVSTIFDNGTSVRLGITAGEDLTVRITKDSLSEMNLTVGSKVYLTFKSTAVEVF